MKFSILILTIILCTGSLVAQSPDINEYKKFYGDSRGTYLLDHSSIEYHGKTVYFWMALMYKKLRVSTFMSTELNCNRKQTRIWKSMTYNVDTGQQYVETQRTGWMTRDSVSRALVKELCP